MNQNLNPSLPATYFVGVGERGCHPEAWEKKKEFHNTKSVTITHFELVNNFFFVVVFGFFFFFFFPVDDFSPPDFRVILSWPKAYFLLCVLIRNRLPWWDPSQMRIIRFIRSALRRRRGACLHRLRPGRDGPPHPHPLGFISRRWPKRITIRFLVPFRLDLSRRRRQRHLLPASEECTRKDTSRPATPFPSTESSDLPPRHPPLPPSSQGKKTKNLIRVN